MQPFAIFAIAAILVSLCAVFLFLGYGVLAGNDADGTGLPKPAVMTAAAVILIGVFLGSIFAGRAILYSDGDTNILAADTKTQVTGDRRELTDLAARVDQAATGVYSGLDTTKDLIGKTEVRKEAIEQGRDHAHGKLASLAERIRAALRGDAPLNTFDRNAAEHVTEGLE